MNIKQSILNNCYPQSFVFIINVFYFLSKEVLSKFHIIRTFVKLFYKDSSYSFRFVGGYRKKYEIT